MISALNIIFLILFILLAPLVLYQFFLSLLAINSKKRTSFEADRNRKFALIVPAHNEENVIAQTLYSLSGLIYPKKLFDVYVVADNCTDETANIARSIGVNVLERTHEAKKGKGYALRWAFDRILETRENYDALIVVDADSLISGNYLEVMNYYLEQGNRVIQSSDLVLPQPGNWSVEATRIGFMLYNYVKPLGRKVLDLNMGLRGNGMCFSADVLREIPWEAWSLTEDVEYGLVLMLRGVKIEFAPEATVWARMPVKAANAESQRSRWEIGRLQIIRAYMSKFLVKTLKERSLVYFDVFLDLITPPFVNMMFMVMLIFIAALPLFYLGALPLLQLMLWGMVGITGMTYLFVGLYVAKAEKSLYKSLLRLPVYVLWKLKVYMKTFKGGKEVNWVRTKRDNR